ncbi:MAG: CDP-alcohol phosphatidyltransferase family protein [Hyphomicrobiaceae bacterium]
MAARLPAQIHPDHLTIMGVAGAVFAAFGLALTNWTYFGLPIAVFGLLVNWLGDSLDGTLARHRKLERPRYGFFVDHVSDLGSQFLIVAGLGLSPFMRYDTALLALAAYLAVSVYTMVKVHALRVMQLSYFGVGPTEIRILIGLGLIVSAVVGAPVVETPAGPFTLFDAGAIVIAGFTLVSLAILFRHDVKLLAKADPSLHAAPVETIVIEIRNNDTKG